MDKNTNTAQRALAREIAKTCRTQEDITVAIKALFAETVETVLQAEMDEHLGYEKHDVSGIDGASSLRNSAYPVMVTSCAYPGQTILAE